jgi:hypothetical protein
VPVEHRHPSDENIVAEVRDPSDAPRAVRRLAEQTLRSHAVDWDGMAYVARVQPTADQPESWVVVHSGPRPNPGDRIVFDGLWSGSSAVKQLVAGKSKVQMVVSVGEHASLSGPKDH